MYIDISETCDPESRVYPGSGVGSSDTSSEVSIATVGESSSSEEESSAGVSGPSLDSGKESLTGVPLGCPAESLGVRSCGEEFKDLTAMIGASSGSEAGVPVPPLDSGGETSTGAPLELPVESSRVKSCGKESKAQSPNDVALLLSL